MAADAGELKARATLDNTEFLSSLKEMVSQVQSGTDAAASGFEKMSQTFEAISSGLESLGIVEVMKKFGEETLNAALALNKLHAGFEAVNGAGEDTEKIFSDLKELGLNSIFSFTETLGPAAKNMMLLGASAEDTGNMMKALVDAASGLKMGPDWINNVSQAIDNMESHLVATQRDMRALEKSGVDAWGALATQLDVSVNEAMQMVKDGTVTSFTVMQAVAADLEQRFKDSAELAKTSWVGAMQILEHSGEEAGASIGQSILKVLNDFAPVLNTLSGLLQQFGQWWESLSEPVQNAVIAFGAALAAVGAITAALPALGAAVGAIAAVFGGWTIPIAAAVAALGLLGKWVYDEWPAIKEVFLQLWNDIAAEWTREWNIIKGWWNSIVGWFAGIINDFAPVLLYLKTLFSPLIQIWTAEWNAIKSVLSSVWGWIKGQIDELVGYFNKVVNAIVGFFKNIPGDSEMSKLAAAWQKGQKAIADTAAATAAETQAIKDNNAQHAQAIQQRIQQAAADKAAENAANAAAKAQKQASDDAAKAAKEQLQYNEDLKKSYDALYAISPEVARNFADMFGGINESATTAQKTLGKVWEDLDTETQQYLTTVFNVGKAFKDLGVSSTDSLQGVADKAAAAYTTIANSGMATAGDLTAAFDSIVKAQQKVADSMNTDVKKAYDQGLISSTDYWNTVVQRAEQSVAQMSDAWENYLATNEQVAAAEKILADDRQKQQQALIQSYTDGIHALGEKTASELADATSSWEKYAQAIGEQLGTNSSQYIQASIKEVESLIAEFKAMGQAPPDAVTAWLKGLQNQLEGMKTPAQQLADAMKALGAVSIQQLNDQIAKYADELVIVQNLRQQGLATDADVAQAQKKIADVIKQETDYYNQQYTPALQKNDQTAQQAAQNQLKSATAVQQGLIGVGNTAEAQAAIQVAAAQNAGQKLAEYNLAGLKTVEDEYQKYGVTTKALYEDQIAAAQKANADILADTTASATAKLAVQVNTSQKILTDQIMLGDSVTEAQKNALAKQQEQLKQALDLQSSQWKTTFDGVKSAISSTFDDLIKTIVTGDGSFSDVLTKMWQSIAEAALKGFLEPVTKAIENFIATTIADLLSGQGLGGVLDSLKKIGDAIAGVFGGGSSAASSAGGAAGGAASTAGGAASAAGSVASSLTSLLGAIGSIGSFITGGIGDIQNIHIENVLGQIESNTRYSALYLGGRSDQGILGVLFKIDEEIAWGATAKATENLRDLFKDWSGPALADLNGILAMWVGTAPYIVDTKVVLEDIRSIAQSMADSVTSGFQQLVVTINAGNLTTADAARQLGNQIAANLTSQLVAIK